MPVGLLFHAALATGQAAPIPAMKPVTLAPGLSVKVPAKASADPDNKSQDPKYKTWRFDTEGASYIVSTLPNYQKEDPGTPADQELAAYVGGVVQEFEHPVFKRQRDALLNGWPGLEDVLEVGIKGIGRLAVRLRVFAIAGSLYAVMVEYSPQSGLPAGAESYLASLTVKDAETPGPLKFAGPLFTPFSPEGGGYTIAMPSTPKPEAQSIGEGKQKTTGHRYIARFGNRIYVAGYALVPEFLPDPGQGERNDAMITTARATLKAIGGKEAGQPRTVAIGGIDFVQIDFTGPGVLAGKVESSLVDRRFLVAWVAYPAGHAGSPDIDTFLNSIVVQPPDKKKQ
ncbi:MAG TPA: hypothetical protein VKT78_10510 [Fimbriimonadaceae bacterium]|nr:hypothetical protein [Fimbriimonadaceae bacterium]